MKTSIDLKRHDLVRDRSSLLHLLTFALFSKCQHRWNSYFSFLSRTHVHHPNIKAFDDLSDAQYKPLRVPSFVWSTETEMIQKDTTSQQSITIQMHNILQGTYASEWIWGHMHRFSLWSCCGSRWLLLDLKAELTAVQFPESLHHK